MGKLFYASELSVTFDDRLLAHLQVVIGAKLRRSEAFFLSWTDDPRAGDGRTSVWVHPSIELRFKYVGSMPSDLNRTWIDVLTDSANSTGGLIVVSEPRGQ